MRRLNIAHVSTYPPRECGIALYTEDLVQSMGHNGFVHDVLAVDDFNLNCKYTRPVSCVINASDPSEYSKAADLLNQSECSVVSLQHEYGIFGGDWGRHILEFTRSLQKPLVTTFHTVLSDLPQLARRSSLIYRQKAGTLWSLSEKRRNSLLRCTMCP